ncbi:MAG TPA: response regulator transcription factor [Thermoanaerobaculia bacterium]|nr:response regulator transcription factor [Thermoanaerobaculia bacterium]
MSDTVHPESPKTRILLVDDHAVVREGLLSLLQRQGDLLVVAEAADGASAIRLYRQHRPDLVVLDLRLPDMDGVAVTVAIRAEFPQARLLVLSSFDGDEDIYRALKAGARAYVLKDSTREELLAAVRAVASGQRSLSTTVAERLAERVAGSELTPRELAVLRQIVSGRSNKQIASALSISEGTVKTHVKSILAKLGVEDRTEAAVLALRRGLVVTR